MFMMASDDNTKACFRKKLSLLHVMCGFKEKKNDNLVTFILYTM